MSRAVNLPGGLLIDGELRRGFKLRPIIGELELFFGEASTHTDNLPRLISELLTRALAELADEAPSITRVQALSAGDRQFLLRELANELDAKEQWVHTHCFSCGEPMDLAFRYSQLPIKTASERFPIFEETLISDTATNEVQVFEVRVPNGADQEALACLDTDESALQMLWQRLITPINNHQTNSQTIEQLNQVQLQQLEAAIEAAAPEVGTQLLANCPDCGYENRIQIDLYGFLATNNQALLTEVHHLASHYHWSERDILQLTRQRRKRYLTLIDRARGMVSSDNAL